MTFPSADPVCQLAVDATTVRVRELGMASPGVEHIPSYGRAKLGQAPIAHINGAAGMHYGTTVRCSCGWRTQVNRAPSKGGRKTAEATWRRHVEDRP